MKKFHVRSGNKVLALMLTAAMVLGIAGCGSTETPAGDTDAAAAEESSEAGAAGEAASGEKIVNIGVTDSLGSINPFVIDQTFINKYAVELEFLPLVDFAEDLSFEYLLADSITTEDNKNFIVHINEDAAWSDGTPITSDDVTYSFLRLASPLVANATLVYGVFEGVDSETGFVE